MAFSLFVGIDYSGAEAASSRIKGLQVYAASAGAPERVLAEADADKRHWKWSRQGVAEYLAALVEAGTPFLAGLDHCFSFPQSYFDRYRLASWDTFLDDFVIHWPLHRPHLFVDLIRDHSPQRIGATGEFRLCERWTSSAKSVFQFDVQGQVAKSSHAGIPWLWHLRRAYGDRLHFWPFDGWSLPEGKSVLAEVYPSVLRNRFPRDDRTTDEQDAYAVARWLQETCQGGHLDHYLHPPLTEAERELASREGWILGIS